MTMPDQDLEELLRSLQESRRDADDAFVGNVLSHLPNEETERLRRQKLEALLVPQRSRTWLPVAVGFGALGAAAWFLPATFLTKPFVDAMNYQWGEPLPVASLLILGSIAALLTKPLWEEA